MNWFNWLRSDTPTFYAKLDNEAMRRKIIEGARDKGAPSRPS